MVTTENKQALFNVKSLLNNHNNVIRVHSKIVDCIFAYFRANTFVTEKGKECIWNIKGLNFVSKTYKN